MKTSPSGAPILSGSGIQSVRERIQKKFDEARHAGATSSVPAANPAAIVPKAPRALAEKAAPLLQVAGRQVSQNPIQHARYHETHVIVCPAEPAALLIEQALSALSAVLQPAKDTRPEIEEED
jgi:hypothetical protein